MIRDNPLFQQGIAEFQTGEYYRCHDSLEAVWMETQESEKTFVQGILQISVACYHLTHGNQKGCMILLGEGIKRLKEYLPEYEQVDVRTLIESSSHFLGAVQCLEEHEAHALGEWIQTQSQCSNQWVDSEGNKISLPILKTTEQ
ncbi:MAG: DUF309 domain-containing protein [Alkalinema sp. RL_2_19]|nr:DUF309 domain-containing protein [Alkalinema sp. RL_2_19]